MKLSIIIVNYNTQPLTKALIESLLLDKTIPRNTEILVVDNDSQDNSVAFLRSDFPEITVIEHSENQGLAAGVNAAIEQASGTYYLILNPDMIALAGSVKELVDFMDRNPDAGMAGGKLVSPNGRLQYSCYRFYSPLTILYRRTFLGRTGAGKRDLARFLMKDFDHASEKDVDWLMGACLIVRASLVEEIGGMDPRYFLYFEDVDWARRVWEAGWRVTYVPQAVFSHFHQQSSKRNAFIGLLVSKPTREHLKSAIRYFWKFRGRPLPEHS